MSAVTAANKPPNLTAENVRTVHTPINATNLLRCNTLDNYFFIFVKIRNNFIPSLI